MTQWYLASCHIFLTICSLPGINKEAWAEWEIIISYMSILIIQQGQGSLSFHATSGLLHTPTHISIYSKYNPSKWAYAPSVSGGSELMLGQSQNNTHRVTVSSQRVRECHKNITGDYWALRIRFTCTGPMLLFLPPGMPSSLIAKQQKHKIMEIQVHTWAVQITFHNVIALPWGWNK